MPGKLYIVATPIGNLNDITFRAIEVLKSVSLIAAEDTRQTKKLLAHYDIHTPITSYFEYNKLKKTDYLIGLLKDGKDIALVSDSGTPGIMDPGFLLIKTAIENSIPVTLIPGPAAFVGGLVLSGFPTDRFIFEGFLPSKQGQRKKRLAALKDEKRTILLYESPHRILKTLKDILEVIGDREISITRELTKFFEETRRGKVSQILEYFSKQKPRGEFVVVIKGHV